MARPKREFTDEELKEIERLARINCKTQTIADALQIPYNTLKRNFGRRMTNWRALGRCKLRTSQDKLSEISSDMAKFLGKNTLGQVDKIETVNKTEIINVPEAEKEATDAACEIYKLKLAGTA